MNSHYRKLKKLRIRDEIHFELFLKKELELKFNYLFSSELMKTICFVFMQPKNERISRKKEKDNKKKSYPNHHQ